MVTQQAVRWLAATCSSGGSFVKHSSRRKGQRGVKAHPEGGWIRSGGNPSIERNRSLRSASMRGSERSSDHVYGCCGLSKICSTGPCSTIWPPYMTRTRNHRPPTTHTLCVIISHDVP